MLASSTGCAQRVFGCRSRPVHREVRCPGQHALVCASAGRVDHYEARTLSQTEGLAVDQPIGPELQDSLLPEIGPTNTHCADVAGGRVEDHDIEVGPSVGSSLAVARFRAGSRSSQSEPSPTAPSKPSPSTSAWCRSLPSPLASTKCTGSISPPLSVRRGRSGSRLPPCAFRRPSRLRERNGPTPRPAQATRAATGFSFVVASEPSGSTSRMELQPSMEHRIRLQSLDHRQRRPSGDVAGVLPTPTSMGSDRQGPDALPRDSTASTDAQRQVPPDLTRRGHRREPNVAQTHARRVHGRAWYDRLASCCACDFAIGGATSINRE